MVILMAKIDSSELNRKLQETNVIYLAIVSAIFLAFWFFAMPKGTFTVAAGIVLFAFLVYFYVVRPRMQSLITNLGKEK